VLVAQAVFLLDCGQTVSQTHRQTDTTERPTHARNYAGMSSKWTLDMSTRRQENKEIQCLKRRRKGGIFARNKEGKRHNIQPPNKVKSSNILVHTPL